MDREIIINNRDIYEIYKYLETNIRDIYKMLDGCHNEKHFDEVYDASKALSEYGNLSENNCLIVQVAAAYHDTGYIVSSENHESYSSKIFLNDINMKRWLTNDERSKINDIILSHHFKTASFDNIYRNILRDADNVYKMNRDRWIEKYASRFYDTYMLQNDLYNLNEQLNVYIDQLFKMADPEFQGKEWLTPMANELWGKKPVFELPTKNEVLYVALQYGLSKK